MQVLIWGTSASLTQSDLEQATLFQSVLAARRCSITGSGGSRMGRRLGLMNEEISRAVTIFRSSPNLKDEEVFVALINRGTEKELAARLVEFLPMAYSRLILSKSGARFADTFRRNLPGGVSQEKPLSSEPVWGAVV